MKHLSVLAALAASALTLPLAACGAGTSHPAALSATSSSSTVTCSQASGMIQLILAAQQKLDASQQTTSDDELYVISINEGIAIAYANHWPDTGALGHDLHQFASDATQFTNGNVAQQLAVATDITTLAADCGVTGGGTS
ncbi:MAG: hypothetical protein ABSA93_16070 [Streptosporangiaceae bacterium]|jgi:hypothetical protein